MTISKSAQASLLPAFDSMCQPEDEGVVTPVDMQPGEPMRIAVLGLENNPFWIPVKEGTLVVYTNHTSTDQVAGFGGGAKRSIGAKVMASQLRALYDKVQTAAEKP